MNEEIVLKNYDEILDGLNNTLKDLDISNPEHQVDIYLYLNEDGSGTLDTFYNVGGSSWLNDDHICIYHRPPRCEELWSDGDWDMDDILTALKKSKKDIFEELRSTGKIDEDSDIKDISDEDYRYYISKNQEYNNILNEDTAEGNDSNGVYYEQARRILEANNIMAE